MSDLEFIVDCRKCNTKAVAGRVADYDFPDDDFNVQRYVLAQCKICFDVMLLRHLADEKFPSRRAIVLWPDPARTLSAAVPEALRLEHRESRACFRSGAYTAAVVMVRRTLEGVCAEHGIKANTLVKSLEQMKTSNLIDTRLLEWAQELRVLGNEGAHFTGKRVSRRDAEDAVALAEAILDYLYVFSAQFDEFKERRKKHAHAEKEIETKQTAIDRDEADQTPVEPPSSP
jgi:hypothetical protein